MRFDNQWEDGLQVASAPVREILSAAICGWPRHGCCFVALESRRDTALESVVIPQQCGKTSRAAPSGVTAGRPVPAIPCQGVTCGHPNLSPK